MFTITGSKGFHLTFANGYTLSVQFGPGNYCEHRNHPTYSAPRGCDWSLEGAEIAILAPSGAFLPLDNGDKVAGWLTPDAVIGIAARVAAIDPTKRPSIFALRPDQSSDR